MKLAIASVLVSSAAAFTPSAPAIAAKTTSTSLNAFNFGKKAAVAAPAAPSFTIDTIPGALAPVGLFDPLGFADKANEDTLKRYREAELTHGRVAMLATVGFLAGEAVAGKTALFNGEIVGSAVEQITQVNPFLVIFLVAAIGKAETIRAEIGWVEPSKAKFDNPGQLRDTYTPGDIGFDPFQLKPEDPAEFFDMQTKELQNGRLAMLAAAGFLAQEAVDGFGIYQHFEVSMMESVDLGLV